MLRTVEVIGDGGAFDVDKTNSSFLINGSILFDCGYNVFQRLKEIDNSEEGFISNIETVIVSHLDDDHVGSLKSLLYYRYFILGKHTTVIISENDAHFLDGINKEMKGSRFVSADIVSKIGSDDASVSYFVSKYGLRPVFTKCVHHIDAFGIILYDSRGGSVAISGDTKANSAFEDEVRKAWGVGNVVGKKALVFHDFSYFDAPSRQVHACESDVRIEYSEDFREKMILYHNNKAELSGKIYNFTDNGIVEGLRV